MLQGPWREANSPVLTLQIDDGNVNGEAINMALAYLYGHYPKLNDNNAFRCLAAASFLDLQVLQLNQASDLFWNVWVWWFNGNNMLIQLCAMLSMVVLLAF